MLFVTNTITTEEVNEYINENDSDIKVNVEKEEVSAVSQYITSLVSNNYQKAVEAIENTKVGNKVVRKKNLQQVMQESFFYGANRFGNNFIA